MPKYSNSSITAKIGINYVRTIVEESGSLFHKIEQENDLGIDGIIEFIQDGTPTNKSIAIQIKSGDSYFNSRNQELSIPIDSHYNYWLNYPLPVFGIVYIPNLKNAFWVNIKTYIETICNSSLIKFPVTRINQFNTIDFKRLFQPLILDTIPLVSFNEALSYFNSDDISEFNLGMTIMFEKYINEEKTWNTFLDYIQEKEAHEIPHKLIYYLAHIPWHPDIWYSGNNISNNIKVLVLNKIYNYNKATVIKLLSIIGDNMICRGSIGQSIEAILSKVKNINSYLADIITEDSTSADIIKNASIILACYIGKKSLPLLKKAYEKNMIYCH